MTCLSNDNINQLKSYTEVVTKENTASVAVSFDYVYGKDGIVVTIDAKDPTTIGYSVTMPNANTVAFYPSVPTGHTIRLQRETDIDKIGYVFTSGALFIASNMDANFEQIRHAQQEVKDSFDFLENNTLGVVEAAKAAIDHANEASKKVEDALDGVDSTVIHNWLSGRNVPNVHPASSISYGSSNVGSFLDSLVYAGKSFVTDNYTTLAQLQANDGQKAFVKSDGIAGDFRYATTSTATPNGGTIIASTNGGNWLRVYNGALNVKWFGAMGDGVTDDSTAITNWLAALSITGSGYIPTGTYKSTSAILIDVSTFSSKGLTITGDGMQRSVIDLTAVTTGIPLQVIDSNSSTNGDAFYVSMSKFGVHTNIAGVGAALAKHDLTDALNASVFDQLYFANASTSATACALEVNYVVQSMFNVTCNTGGTSTGGDALRIRQAQFCTFTGSGGNATNSLHLTDGYVFGNTFLNFDFEEVQKCVLIDTATVTSNTFIGGQMKWTVAGIDATSGNNNKFINPNFSLPTNKVAGSVGIDVSGDGKSYGTQVVPNTIVRPPSGDAVHYVDAVAGAQGSYIFMRNGKPRWQIRMDNSAESGSNNGSTLVVTRYDDLGNSLGDAMYITRSNGQTTIAKATLSNVGFFGTAAQATKPTVTGAKGGNAALTSLLTTLANLGLVTDNTT